MVVANDHKWLQMITSLLYICCGAARCARQQSLWVPITTSKSNFYYRRIILRNACLFTGQFLRTFLSQFLRTFWPNHQFYCSFISSFIANYISSSNVDSLGSAVAASHSLERFDPLYPLSFIPCHLSLTLILIL